MRKMGFSLPGMTRAEITTSSPGSTATQRWLFTATRDSAAIGSPWLPVSTSATWLRGSFLISCGGMSRPSGMCSLPSRMAISEFWYMLRPTKQRRRPCSCARSATICKRCREVAKQLMSTRPWRLGDDMREALAHGALRRRQARPVDVGGIGEERQHAVAAVVRRACAGRSRAGRAAWDRT